MNQHSQIRKFVTVLAGGASMFALAYGSQPALAQQADQPAASGSGGLEEVIVTARRKEEKAQSVPITLQTFNTEALANGNVTAMYGLTQLTPGVQITSIIPSGGRVQVRGVSGAPLYFNGAPTINSGNEDVYFDIASAQVLKGPQGTLFGVASNGGALVFEPNKPAHSFSGYGQVTLGNYGHYAIEGAVNVPIVEDKVLTRISGLVTHTDGYIYNIARGINLLDENKERIRGIVTINPTEDISNEFLVSYYNSHAYGILDMVPMRLNYAKLQSAPFNALYGTALIAEFALQRQLGPYVVPGDDINGGRSAKYNNWELMNTTKWDINENLQFKNILAYEQLTLNWLSPADLDVGLIGVLNPRNQLPSGVVVPYTVPGPLVQYSDEFQFIGRAFDDKLSYTVGAFNQFTRQADPHPAFMCTSIAAGGISCGGYGGNNNGSGFPTGSGATNGVYGQATYDLGSYVDGLSFTAGYRYSWDRVYQFTGTYTQADVYVPASSGSQIAYSNAPSYTLSLDYQLTPTTLIYASDSKGYSKGGLNSITAPKNFQTYKPEKLDEYELGIKTDNEVFGIKTRANVALYYGDYSEVQTLQYISIPPAAPGLPTTFPSVTGNGGSAWVEGVEGQFTIIPDKAWEFDLDANWNILKYTEYATFNTFVTPPAAINWDWFPPISTPKLKLNAQLTYHPPIAWIAPGEDLGDLSVTTSWSWASVVNQSGTYNPVGFSVNTLEEYPDRSIFNMTVNWHDMLGRHGLDGTFYVTNVFETIWSTVTLAQYITLGVSGLQPQAPRMMGATLRYNFGE